MIDLIQVVISIDYPVRKQLTLNIYFSNAKISKITIIKFEFIFYCYLFHNISWCSKTN